MARPESMNVRGNGSLHLGTGEANASSETLESEESSREQSDIEDYDRLKLDTAAVLPGSRGAGAEHKTELRIETKYEEPRPRSMVLNGRRGSFDLHPSDMGPAKASSEGPETIHVVLEKTNRKGRYVLTAEEPEVRELLRHSIERELSLPGHKKHRKGFREMVFTRQFTTFDRQNPLSSESPFSGFFTLFWLCMAMLLIRVASHNWVEYGHVLGRAEILHMMTDRDLVVLGITDGVMCASTIEGLFFQRLVARGWLKWDTSGWIIQNLWQTFYLGAVIWWTYYREWPWTHTIFTVLHGLVFLMKQHSYAFYNGYLSQVARRRSILESKLHQLADISPVASPVAAKASSPFSQSTSSDARQDGEHVSRRRAGSQPSKASTNLSREHSEISSIAAAIESNTPLDSNQVAAFSAVLKSEIARLTEELNGKCTSTSNTYPHNLTVANWADWTCLPTLVYELEYPRQERINWLYIVEKTAAALGTIWIMIIVSQAYIYPLVLDTIEMRKAGLSLQQRWISFPWVCMDLIFPMLLEQLLTWYVIWECILNVLAEVTRFADRGFYGDWWNSVSWDQYARDWNRPVHNFLLRHVYHSSISALQLSKTTATFVTFLLSALVHELIMWCLFKKVRGYLFCMQLMQIPLASMSRTKLLKGRKVLGNVVFWIGLFLGPSVLTSLYLIA